MRAKTINENLENKPGFVNLVRSEDFHGTSDTLVIPFSSEDELIKILKREGASDEHDKIVWYMENDSYMQYPVDTWADHVLQSIYGGMDGYMGDANDLFAFVDRHGAYGWVSKDERPNDLPEAKRRFNKQ